MNTNMNTRISFKQRGVRIALAAFACAAAVISGPSSAVPTNSASATASGTVIAPITVSKVTDLSFGKFAPGGGGSVTISTSGNRTATGTILSTVGSAPTAASFTVSGDPAATYGISFGGAAILTNTTGGGGETMTLTKISDLTGANATSGTVSSGTLDGGGAQTIFVGGTLAVGASQVAGDYAGSVDVTVQYN